MLERATAELRSRIKEMMEARLSRRCRSTRPAVVVEQVALEPRRPVTYSPETVVLRNQVIFQGAPCGTVAAVAAVRLYLAVELQPVRVELTQVMAQLERPLGLMARQTRVAVVVVVEYRHRALAAVESL